jgi:hypothetical protein
VQQWQWLICKDSTCNLKGCCTGHDWSGKTKHALLKGGDNGNDWSADNTKHVLLKGGDNGND